MLKWKKKNLVNSINTAGGVYMCVQNAYITECCELNELVQDAVKLINSSSKTLGHSSGSNTVCKASWGRMHDQTQPSTDSSLLSCHCDLPCIY